MIFTSHKYRYYRRALRILYNRSLNRDFVRKDLSLTIEVSGLCNLICVFCAYEDKEQGKKIMTLETFSSLVNQLVDLGRDHLGLTPQTGDVFIDKQFQKKLEFLENHDGIKSYEFITNLVSAPHATLDYISKSKKLLHMHVSVYGRDGETFEKVTRRPRQQYERLVENLNYLAKIGADMRPAIGAFTMAERDFKWSPSSPPQDDDSELMIALRLLNASIPQFLWTGNHVDFDSWGGKITQAKMDDVGMGFEIVGPTVPMFGPCSMLFGGFVILADGQVNACACRAVDKSLIIGDTTTTPLYEIVSPDNPVYAEILRKHQNSDYPSACQGCKIFGSIYRRPHHRETVSVQEFLNLQRQRCENAKAKSQAKG